MGFSFRKSIKIGPARINVSKSGVGYSVGAGGLRYTKSPKSKAKGKSKGGTGVLGKCVLYLLAFLALVGLAVSYWQWALSILAVVLACVIGYRVYVNKKTCSEDNSELEEQADNNPVP